MPADELNAPGRPQAVGPYRVLHQVGAGVLGPVFRTHDPIQDRLIAVKSITLELVPEEVTRLAAALRDVSARPVAHRGAVNVITAGQQGGRAYFATEYVAGESLELGWRHLAPMPLDRVVDLLRSLAAVIDAAWEAGVGHGALHPRDVFLMGDGSGVRVTGIGIALALHRAGLKAPVRRPYTAPERGDGGTWSIAADVYSIGVIAYELLTRRRLGAAEQEGEREALVPDQPATVRRILATALAADPTQRFHSAGAFVDALEEVAASAAPVPAPRPTPTPEPQLPPSDLVLRRPPAVASSTPVADLDLQRPSAPAPSLPPRVTVARRADIPPSAPWIERFSWKAIAAVSIAALLVSLAGGYAVGLRYAARPIPAVTGEPTPTVARVAPDSPAVPRPIASEVATDPGKAVDPPRKSIAPQRGELSGSWVLTNRVEQSNVAAYQDLTLSFRLELEQDGNQLSGRGLKWEENGRRIPSRGRTPITVTGTLEGNTVVLSFTERGTRRTTHGRLRLQRIDDGVLDGRFSSDAAASSGHARAVRVSSS